MTRMGGAPAAVTGAACCSGERGHGMQLSTSAACHAKSGALGRSSSIRPSTPSALRGYSQSRHPMAEA
jgi:hypothetical protein